MFISTNKDSWTWKREKMSTLSSPLLLGNKNSRSISLLCSHWLSSSQVVTLCMMFFLTAWIIQKIKKIALGDSLSEPSKEGKPTMKVIGLKGLASIRFLLSRVLLASLDPDSIFLHVGTNLTNLSWRNQAHVRFKWLKIVIKPNWIRLGSKLARLANVLESSSWTWFN